MPRPSARLFWPQELTALEDLQLKPLILELEEHVAFPPCLTRLGLEGYGERQQLPPAVGGLGRRWEAAARRPPLACAQKAKLCAGQCASPPALHNVPLPCSCPI